MVFGGMIEGQRGGTKEAKESCGAAAASTNLGVEMTRLDTASPPPCGSYDREEELHRWNY